MWTVNRVLAAPVLVSKRHLARAEPQAVVSTQAWPTPLPAPRGSREQSNRGRRPGARSGLAPEQVVVLSTGVIGVPLPSTSRAGRLEPLRRAHAGRRRRGSRGDLTTDSGPKTAVALADGFTVGGMAKGAGMIHPCLATMLAVITTDYPLEPGEPLAFLRPTVEASFNRISVDGECSTNDAVVLLANGASGARRTAATDAAFADALGEVCAELSRRIVADGEGSTVLLEVDVSGASSEAEALAVARRVATSPLVKTAAFGRDPNWGRVLAAAGSAPFNGGFAQLDPDLLRLSFDGTTVFADGAPTGRQVAPPWARLPHRALVSVSATAARRTSPPISRTTT